MPSIFTRQHLSPYITLFLFLPLIVLIVPNPLERLYQIATFNINMTMMNDDHRDRDDDSRGHEHTHHQSHAHTQDADHDTTTFLEKNRIHWDSRASTYTSAPWAKEMLNSIHAFVLSNINWIGVPFVEPSTSFEYNPSSGPSDLSPSQLPGPSGPVRPVKVLDYACGSGTITNILYSHAHEFVGIDISPKMVEEYNRRFSHNLPQEVAGTNARAFVGNLINPTSSAEDGAVKEAEPNSFDLVVVGLGFHHFENLDLAVQRLSEYLRPDGGVLVIVDLLAHGKESIDEGNPAKHTVAHHGFNEQQMKELFERNGLKGGFGFVVMEGEVLMRGTERRRVFMARGVRGKRVEEE